MVMVVVREAKDTEDKAGLRDRQPDTLADRLGMVQVGAVVQGEVLAPDREDWAESEALEASGGSAEAVVVLDRDWAQEQYPRPAGTWWRLQISDPIVDRSVAHPSRAVCCSDTSRT